MGIGTGTAAIIGGTSLAGSVVGAVGANAAANTQANAANNAAQLQYNLGQQSLNQNQQQWLQNQQNIAPWLQAGTGALSNLSYLMGTQPQNSFNYGQTPGTTPPSGGFTGAGGSTGATLAGLGQGTNPQATGQTWDTNGNLIADPNAAGAYGNSPTSALTTAGTGTTPAYQPTVNTSLGGYGSLSQPWTQQFQAPTNVTEQNDPGYQFRLQQGQKALENSAAARGGLLSGGTGKALAQYGQDYASNEYGNVYNRALGQYQQNYNIFQNNQANQFNRLSALSGTGQTAAGQLSSAGQNYANTAANINLTTGQQVGNNINNAAAARGSGYVGAANAIGGGISGLSSLAMLQALGGGGGSSVINYPVPSNYTLGG